MPHQLRYQKLLLVPAVSDDANLARYHRAQRDQLGLGENHLHSDADSHPPPQTPADPH